MAKNLHFVDENSGISDRFDFGLLSGERREQACDLRSRPASLRLLPIHQVAPAQLRCKQDVVRFLDLHGPGLVFLGDPRLAS